MKFLLLIFMLISTSSFAGWVKESELIAGDIKKSHTSNGRCGEGCIEIPDRYNPAYHKRVEITENDYNKPNYEAKSNIVSCNAIADNPATTEIDETKTILQDCVEKAAALDCPESDTSHPYFVVRAADNSQVYCTRVVSYLQKSTGRYEVKEDAALKATYEGQAAAKKIEADAINQRIKDMDFGKRIYAAIQLLSKAKGLTKAQRRQFRNTNKDIKDDLLEGNICNARSDMATMAVDGVLITSQSEINGILAKIDAYKTCE